MASSADLIGSVRAAAEVLDSMPDGVALVSADGTFTYANRRMEEITGYSAAELLTLKVEDLVPATLRSQHRRQRADFLSRPASRPMGTGLRIDLRRMGGGEIPVDISLGSLGEGVATVVVVRDVAQRESGERVRIRRAVVSDRSRLTRRLQDEVIQNLFATGLSLQKLTLNISDPTVREQVDHAVASTDRAIRLLRDVIFESTDPYS